ncbi:hypothetical protein KIN20_020855 [Parelaphostrongylus tenuis]|uniref:Uncharacterized protein n=1 Tax=Parelaphostrongylus tenuis TaxID=148309 RepID=A0AAD5MN32_PARTN|nr:hypothetical protein KIN20_020855 [Parelaphostrongylus tenuis]
MKISLILICLILRSRSDDLKGEDANKLNIRSMEVMLIDLRNIIRLRLEKCIADWDESFQSTLSSRHLEEYWNSALQAARDRWSESVECLMQLKSSLAIYKKLSVAVDERKPDENYENSEGLHTTTSRHHLNQLRRLQREGERDAIEKALRLLAHTVIAQHAFLVANIHAQTPILDIID